MLNVVDEFTGECLAIRVARELGSAEVIDVLADLFIMYGTPGHIRSDSGPAVYPPATDHPSSPNVI